VRLSYVAQRVLLLFATMWMAASVNFVLPRLATGRDPIRERIIAESARGGGATNIGINEMIAEYRVQFGLDEPLPKQYVTYLWNTLRFDLGKSLSNYPKTVIGLITEALPWTLGIVTFSTITSFTLGTIFGALIAWPRAPRVLSYTVPILLTFSAVPFYILGLILIYFFAFQLKWFPIGGGYPIGTIPSFSLAFMGKLAYHAILPSLSMILASTGGWALGMRGMMVTIQGEDYMNYAEAKGLPDSRIFFGYAVRNAMLPQTTGLALSLGYLVAGAGLVEVVFGYPGIGSLLGDAISKFDYTTIYGIVFFLIVSLGVVLFIIDLLYPLIDPRITYEQ
jgi:peptide/nickel transport system permease protein